MLHDPSDLSCGVTVPRVTVLSASRPTRRRVRAVLASWLCAFLVACGGGGGGEAPVTPAAIGNPSTAAARGVSTGYTPVTDSGGVVYGEGGGDSSGGDSGSSGGDSGGAGAGAGLGAFVNAVVTVERADRTVVGSAVTDAFGMVSIRNGGDKQPLLITVQGAANATYWDEALQQQVAFPATEKLHAMVAATGTGQTLGKNIGITLLTEAAYQYALTNLGGVDAWRSAANIRTANQAVAVEFNRFLPSNVQIDDITRLPALAHDATTQVFATASKNVEYGLVTSGLVRAIDTGSAGAAPGLELLKQFSLDLSDGKIDAIAPGNVAIDPKTYAPATLSANLLAGAKEMANVNGKALPVVSYQLGGSVGGLTSNGLVLTTRAVDTAVPANATLFTLGAVLVTGSAYDVTVKTQPIGLVCSVANGTGTAASANIGTVAVTCSAAPTPTFSVGGTVTGLTGTGLVLQSTGANNLAVTANGNFTFTAPIASGNAYSVTVLSQPSNPAQICSVANGSGTVSAAVASIAVSCVNAPPPTFSVSATVAGLAGTGLVLVNNGGGDLAVTANGTQTFTARATGGSTYAIAVRTQPVNPAQTCLVSNGTGSVTANVTAAVVCSTNTYTVGATVSGLTGTVVLQNNGGDNLSLSANNASGIATFSQRIASGSTYGVTVLTAPADQVCSVSNGAGTVVAANISTVAVACVTKPPLTFSVSATVSGLVGTNLVLRNNGGNDLPITGNGNATFSIPVVVGNGYAVTVGTQPVGPSQVCTVTNGSGTIPANNVTNVSVACTTSSFPVSGTVSGLAGSGLVLVNNGGANLPVTTAVSANGTVSFSAAAPSGSAYDIAVLTQPSIPMQACTVTNGTGTVGATSVLNIAVACTNQTVRYAYVASQGDGTVSSFAVHDVTGRLSLIDRIAAGSGAAFVTVDPSQRYAYVSNLNDATVSQYSIGASGSLTPMTPATVAASIYPTAVAIDPRGRFAYVTNGGVNSISQYTLNASGGLVPIAGAASVAAGGGYPSSIVVHPNGRYAYVAINNDSTVAQFAIGANGGLTPMIPLTVPTGANPSRITVDPSGRFAYAANTNGSNLSQYTIGTDGRLTPVAGAAAVATGQTPNAVAVDPSGRFAYASIYGEATAAQFTIGAGGALTPIAGAATVAAGSGPAFVKTDPSGKFAYVLNGLSNSVSQYTIGANGALTPNALVSVSAPGNPSAIAFSSGATASAVVATFAYTANTGGNSVSAFSISANGTLAASGSPVAAGCSPEFIAAHPNRRFVYVTNFNGGSSTVSQYAIGSNGALTPLTPATIPAGAGAWGIKVHPNGKFAYATNLNGGTVSMYAVAANGTLAALSQATVAAGNQPMGLSIDPSGRYAYVANAGTGAGGNYVSQYAIGADGILTPMSPAFVTAGTGPYDVTVDPSGRYAYVATFDGGASGVLRYTIGANGALTPMTPALSQAGQVPSSVVVEPSGRFAYMVDGVSNADAYLYQYAIGAGGALSPIGSPILMSAQSGTSAQQVIADPGGKYVYVSIWYSDVVAMYAITANGTLAPLTATAPSGTVAVGAATFPRGITSIGSWQ